MFYKENVGYPKLIWNDLAFQIDHMKEKRIGEDYQEYGLAIPEVMLNDAIKQSKSYQMFIKYSTNQIPPKKGRGKGSQRKKTADDSRETVDISKESEPEPERVKRKTTSRRVVKKKVIISADDDIISNPDVALELESVNIIQALKESKKTSKRQPGTRGSSEGTGTIPGVLNESTIVSTTSSERTEQESKYSEEDQLDDEEKDDKEDEDGEMLNDEVEDSNKGDEEVTDATKADAEKTLEVNNDAKKSKLPLISSSLSVSLSFGDQFPKLSSDSSLVSTVKDTTDAEINSLLETPTVDLEQEYEKSPSEILKIKKEQAEKQKMLKFTIKSTDTQLSNTPIEDENAMDKRVADTVQDHKRKHDNDEDDNDEDPSARPNQGKKKKRRRANESESSKKPSITKKTPKGKDPSKGSKTSKCASVKEPVEEPIAEVVMDDAVNNVVCDDDQPQDASEPKTAKTLNPEWFTQPPRPHTLDLNWNKRHVVLDQPEQPWFNQMVVATKDPLTFNDLMATPIEFSNNIELDYHFQECFNVLTDRLDWNNPEGDRYPFDLSKPLPLQGHPGHLTVGVDYFFNNELEYLKSFDLEKTYTTLITKTKEARRKLWHKSQLNKFSKHNVYSTKKILGVKSVSVKKLHRYYHLEEIVVKRDDRQLFKFKEGDFVDLHINDIKDMLLLVVRHKLFHLTDSDIVDFIMALQHQSDTKSIHNNDGNPFRANIKQALRVICEDMLKGTLFGAEMMIFEDSLLLLNTSYPEKKIPHINAWTSQENAHS
nr:hypothetical protein [Tanacetum cinerariifolium]